jgi:hypothetical protein
MNMYQGYLNLHQGNTYGLEFGRHAALIWFLVFRLRGRSRQGPTRARTKRMIVLSRTMGLRVEGLEVDEGTIYCDLLGHTWSCYVACRT